MFDEKAETYTLAIQYFADSMDKFDEYQNLYAAALQREYTAKFGDAAPAFRTLLEAIEEGEVVSSQDISAN